MMEELVNSKERFAAVIRELAEKDDLDLIEALVEWCEMNEMQVDDVLHLLDKSFTEDIKNVAIANRYVIGFAKPKTLF